MEKYCPQQGQPERGDIVFVAEALSQVSQRLITGVSIANCCDKYSGLSSLNIHFTTMFTYY